MKWIPYSKSQLRELKNILKTTIDRTDSRKTAINNFSLVHNRPITSVSQKLSSLNRKVNKEVISKDYFPKSNHVRVNEITIPIISMKINDNKIIITY